MIRPDLVIPKRFSPPAIGLGGDGRNATYALLDGTVQVVPLLTGPDGALDIRNLGHETVKVEVRIAGTVLAHATVPYAGQSMSEVVLRMP